MSAVRARPASASSSTQRLAATHPYNNASSTMRRTVTRPPSASSLSRTSRARSSAAAAYHDLPPSSSALRAAHAQQREEAEAQLMAQRLQHQVHLSQREKEAIVEGLAAEQNGYLLLLLEKEQANETERARLLAAVDDVGDQRRLEKIFALERAKASEAIKQLTRQHERTLALKMHELGMISDDDDDEHFP